VLRTPPEGDMIRFDATKNFADGVMQAPDMIGA
jgi:hypothetical protein